MTVAPPVSLFLASPAATDRLGALLAATQPARATVFLEGDLGAGKSSLARAWLRALGVDGPIRSPTYTLVERYPLAGGGDALHLDLYRISQPGELEFLALDDAGPRLWLVEWPERGGKALPAPSLRVALAVEAAGRRCVLAPCDAAGADWLASDRLAEGLRAIHEA